MAFSSGRLLTSDSRRSYALTSATTGVNVRRPFICSRSLPVARVVASLAFLLFGCGESDTNAASDAGGDLAGDTVTPPLCDAPPCISVEGEGSTPGLLVDEGPNSACFRGSGFHNFTSPRVIVDGVEIMVAGGNNLTCLGGLLPEGLHNGDLWLVQAEDADGDGAPDPGSDIESNRLRLVTRPWITGVTPSEVRVGEPITISAENLPPAAVRLNVAHSAACVMVADEPAGGTLTVTPTSDTLAQACSFELTVGDRWANNPRATGDNEFRVTILPTATPGCANRAGLPCTILGTGLGADTGGAGPAARTVLVDGEAVDHQWSATSVTFTIPEDMEPGVYPVRMIREDGHVVESELRVMGWGRQSIRQEMLGFTAGHTGTLSDLPVSFIADDGSNALMQRNEFYVGYGFGVEGWGPVNPSSTDPLRPFYPGTYIGPEFSSVPWTHDIECGRYRTMLLPPVQDLIDGPPLLAVAGPRRGHCGWEDVAPEFPIEIGVYHSDGAPLFDRFSELLSFPLGDRYGTAGMARFVFDSQPPRPDPEGRPGRYVPIVAIANVDEQTTELFRLYGAELIAHNDEPYAGIGTLHEAGEYLYLAGGEDGFTGTMYEVGWSESREIPPPIDGLPPERMPHFAGGRDGTLWVVVVRESGAVEIHRWFPDRSEWVFSWTVPNTVPGADRPGLGDNPAALGFFDMAVFEGRPVIATAVRAGASLDAALYATDPDGGWYPLYEEIALWEWEDRPCGGWVPAGDPRSTPSCPPNQHEIYAPRWRRMEGVVESLRLWSAEDAVWVRYRRSDDQIAQGHADLVARPLTGVYGR